MAADSVVARNDKRCVLELPHGPSSSRIRSKSVTGLLYWTVLLEYFEGVSKNRCSPKDFILLIRFPTKLLSTIPGQTLRVPGG